MEVDLGRVDREQTHLAGVSDDRVTVSDPYHCAASRRGAGLTAEQSYENRDHSEDEEEQGDNEHRSAQDVRGGDLGPLTTGLEHHAGSTVTLTALGLPMSA